LPATTDKKFADFPLNPDLRESLDQAGFQTPTPVQAACVGPALEGKDVIGLAQTGTGKTAAFAIPMIQRMHRRCELGGLVLAPTRELAAQITTEFEMLGARSGIRVATIVGGVKMEEDYNALSSWPNILVATPGRLIDHIFSQKVSLKEIEMFAVDEADRMHDMGFIPQINQIIEALPAKRQTLMFTATMPDDVEQIARKSMNDPVRLQIGVTAPAHRAKQELYELPEEQKTDLLRKLLKKNDGRTLVFVRTKRNVDRLTRNIRNKGFDAARIHGGMEQEYRQRALEKFRDGSCRILVATDIAARGLDISEVEHVVNYDFPHHPEDYVHRVGRTARLDASGLASSFITRHDRRYVKGVRSLIGDKLPEVQKVDGGDSQSSRSNKKGSRPRNSNSKGKSGRRRRRRRSSGKRRKSKQPQ
jgi:ATP-dependent RNA helicase RhlE